MEKEKAISEMRKVLKRRSRLLLLPIGASVVLAIFHLVLRLTPLVGGEYYSGVIAGFVTGLLTGIDLLCLFLLFRTRYILREDDRVYRQYILENDERKSIFAKNAAFPGIFCRSELSCSAALWLGISAKRLFPCSSPPY